MCLYHHLIQKQLRNTEICEKINFFYPKEKEKKINKTKILLLNLNLKLFKNLSNLTNLIFKFYE